jgi:catechol 2,3-dioxygenase-like lactoylglutathione lyase family enzyme
MGGAAAMSLLAAHGAIARAARTGVRAARRGDTDARILGLRLRTAAPLDTMKSYYCDLLGMTLVESTGDVLTVKAGATAITFETAGPDEVAPFYHFAFNIPEHKILAAGEWQLQRTPLFNTPEHMRDAGYPDDVRHFRGWNAHSVFFFDPAENVLEYIARHDLPATRDQGSAGDGFAPADVLYASEIGFVVDDVQSLARQFASSLDMDEYRPGNDAFQAMGDERGLLLIFRTGRNIGTGSGKDKPCRVFQTEAAIRGALARELAVDGYPYRIAAK